MFASPSQDFVYVRTYSRWIEELKRRETWSETVERYINFIEDERGEKIPSKVIKKIKQAILSLDVMPSMRALWAAGEAARRDNTCMYNCSFLAADSISSFAECLYILMCGTGVGFSVEKKYVDKLPSIAMATSEGDGIYVITDDKKGWAESLKILMQTLYRGRDIQFDYSKIRKKGEKLKVMGGRASGPEPLIKLHLFVREVFSQAQGRKLTSLECHDIMNEIAEIVVVGGVRRSSQISVSDLDDAEMRDAKIYPFPKRRFMANNSAIFYIQPTATEFLQEWAALAASGSGERGIFNIQAAKKNAPARRNAELIAGLNPCAEIMLRLLGFCNLSEVVVKADDDLDDLMSKVETAVWIGVIQATFTKFPYLRRKWKQNCEEEMLLGVSLTGQLDNSSLMTKDNLTALKKKAIKIAKKASKIMEVNCPVAITTGKPSGCQVKSTMVSSDKGILTLSEIGDIEGAEWQKHSIIVNSDSENKNSSNFYVNGFANTKKIHMKSGVVLESTLNHKYRMLVNGDYVWTQAGDLQEGDCLPYRVGGYVGGSLQELLSVQKPYCNVREINQPKIIDEDLAWLLGLYIGDGSNHAKGIRIAGDANKVNILVKAAQIVKDKFNIDGIIHQKTKGNNADLYLNSTYLLSFLRANSLLKQKTGFVEIPISIRQSPKEVIRSYIDGYTAADGHIDSRGRIIICTISQKMSQQLPIVMRAIGMNCSVRLMPPTETSFGTNMRYRIQTKKNSYTDITKKRLQKHIQVDIGHLEKLGLDTLTPDYVDFIEDSSNNTFDIEVPDGNTFIANSYVSHNTVSQLVDCASGAHPRYSAYNIRRYRISSTDPLFHMLKDQGVPMNPEVGQREHEKDIKSGKLTKAKGWSADKVDTWVLDFPQKAPDNAVLRDHMTAIQQLEHYKTVQTNWCEHNQSITVYVRDNEWFEVGNWVYKHWDIVNGVSFLPYDGGSYELAPYQEIDKETYDKLLKSFPEIDYSQLSRYEMEDNTQGSKSYSCVGDKCELK